MWNKIRRIPPKTFKNLHHLLKIGINPRQGRGAKARILKWTSYFKLNEDDLILQTDIPLPDLIDESTGKGVLNSYEVRTYKVIYDPQQAEESIRSYYLAPYAFFLWSRINISIRIRRDHWNI